MKVECESTVTVTVSDKVSGAPKSGATGREPAPAKLFAPTLGPPLNRPQTATSKLFAPRTEEMNKGFLMFSEEEPGLTSKLLFYLNQTFTETCTLFCDYPYIACFEVN